MRICGDVILKIIAGGKSFLLPLLFVMHLLAPAFAGAQTVQSIDVRGATRIKAASIVKTFGIQPGDRYSADEIAEGIRNLYATRQFRTVAIERRALDGGDFALTIEIDERPVLGDFSYQGNDKLKKDDLKEETILRRGLVLSERSLFREKVRIQNLYKEKGYRSATIEWELTEPDTAGRQSVVYLIDEGNKVKVKRVVVRGADKLGEGEVRGEMKTKPDNWYRSGDFKEEEFEEDKTRIERLYAKNGYLDARVDSTSVVAAKNGKDLTVSVYVTEGDQYRMGGVKFEGNEQFETDVLRRTMRLRPGDVFDQEKYEFSIGELYGVYSEEGYIFTNIIPERTPKGQVIDLAFYITEGDPARIDRVNIAGNNKTKERTIRRELVVAPGDLFKRSRIIRSQRELMQLGFFQDIRFDYQPVRGTDRIDITFDVVERTTGEASMGAGFSSLNGATGFLRLSQGNLFGGGERVNLTWEFGDFQQIELSYTEPWLFDTPTSAGFDITSVRRNWDSYVEKRKGGGVRLGRRLPWLDYSRVDAAYRIEERTIDPDEDASESVQNAAGTRTLSSTRLSFTRNSTDRLFHPTSGSVNILVGEWAGGILAGSTDYQQYEVETRWYYPSFWKFFLGLRARIGVVDGLDKPSTVPLYKRYRLGGTGVWGLRGYDDRAVVPDGNSFDFGGRSMLILSAEYKFPIADPSIFGLFFFDAGNTWNSFEEIRPNGLKRGAGFGVRFQIPMLGQMGFDMGYGLDRDGGGGWEPHFQLGSLF
ncbi:MAG: outer membrane protein assembly factor BamA [Gemmatimonadetes bacterium]|nr:outer membrane protein assembly factor BamA [Gemmatimonadota bacterium]